MSLRFRCACGSRLVVASRHEGRLVRCPKCGQRVLASADSDDTQSEDRRASSTGNDRGEALPSGQSEPKEAASDARRSAPPRPPERSPRGDRQTKAEFTGADETTKRAPHTNQAAPPPPPTRRSHPTEEPARQASPHEPPPRRSNSQMDSPNVEQDVSAPPAPGVAGEDMAAYEPDSRRATAARQLGAALVVLALVSLAPAAWDVVEHLQAEGSLGVTLWAYGVFWLALVQVAYGLYAQQLPDWSTLWVLTLVTLFVSTMYAVLLGITLIAGPQSSVVAALDLADPIEGGRAAGWCFIMLSVTGLISYLCGRISVRWHNSRRSTGGV